MAILLYRKKKYHSSNTAARGEGVGGGMADGERRSGTDGSGREREGNVNIRRRH